MEFVSVLTTTTSHTIYSEYIEMPDDYLFFLSGYSHIFIKNKISLIQSLWLSLPTSMFSRDQTCIFILIEI